MTSTNVINGYRKADRDNNPNTEVSYVDLINNDGEAPPRLKDFLFYVMIGVEERAMTRLIRGGRRCSQNTFLPQERKNTGDTIPCISPLK
jgi:hypothetical protein